MSNKKGNTLYVHVLERYMTPEELSAFMERYLANKGKKSWGMERPVDDEDRNIYKDFVSGLTPTDIMKKYERSLSKVQTSLTKVLRELNPKK